MHGDNIFHFIENEPSKPRLRTLANRSFPPHIGLEPDCQDQRFRFAAWPI